MLIPDLKFTKISCGQTGPDEVEKGCDSLEYHYNMGSGQVERKPEPIPPYDLCRRVEFFDYEEQLDMLWHDIDEGRLPVKKHQNGMLILKLLKNSIQNHKYNYRKVV